MAQVPVILLTSASRSGMKIEGLESEVDICLAFPFDIAHLRNVVGQLLRRYESLKDYGRSAYSAFDLAQGHLLHKEDKVSWTGCSRSSTAISSTRRFPHSSSQTGWG